MPGVYDRHVASAAPYEPHLVPATLDARFLPDLPTRLIGDRAYDSDALDELLMTRYGIEMIVAHRYAQVSLGEDQRQHLGLASWPRGIGTPASPVRLRFIVELGRIRR
jgi:hypothetical protein